MDGVKNKMQITLLSGKNLGIMQQHIFTYEVDSLTRHYSIAPYLPQHNIEVKILVTAMTKFVNSKTAVRHIIILNSDFFSF